MKRLGKILTTLVIVLIVLALSAGAFGVYTVRRAFPRTSGNVQLAGLDSPVDVYRDSAGIPHIYASTVHDLFMAQGYVHAQDRFYQMDFWRHQTSGRLAELYGDGLVGTDTFLRTVGWHAIAEQEYALAEPETKAMLDAYAAGVNAYLQGRSAADLSLEYSLLGLTGLKNYTPDPWTPADTLAWGKAMAWDLGSNLDSEIARAVLLPAIGPEKTAEYMPLSAPSDHPLALPNPALGGGALSALQARLNELDTLFGERFAGIGSNNWVIAGSRTTTGLPLLANDPHLGLHLPSIWYEIGLHCTPLGPACPYDVRGFSFAGVPAIIIGHNNRIAWGFTNAYPDVQDLVIEKINPANPNQYEVNGEWVEMDVREETITVLGGESQTITIRATRHGPIITAAYGLEDFAAKAGLDPGGQYALALRWTTLQPNQLFQAVFQLNRAQNFAEFRDALRNFAAPSQNIIYADVDGNIGYQVPGLVPIRAQGDGTVPVPGWTDEYEWIGYIPFEDLPYSYNPPQGYIATANNPVVGPDYPYMFGTDWDPGYRARRIVDLIEAQPKVSPEYIQQMQGDDLSLGAQEILPALLALRFDEAKLAGAADQLRGWDFQQTIDSQPAAIYMSYLNALVQDTFADDLPEGYASSGGPEAWVTLRGLLADPDSDWWDNQDTPAVERRDDILRQAFAEGYAALEQRLGSDPSKWTWGALHTMTFENETLGRSGVSLIEGLFNRGPFATAGGTGIVNATGANLARDDADPTVNAYAVSSGPSMRMIVDLSSLEQSVTMHTTGQSGHAYAPHYIDFADDWRLIRYHPMLWERAAVEADAEARLTLTP
ncbi:MAG: penicillin acylase family protein [Anaerolineales bacterium]|nr:penicillin acylase family protein [Anaerolineales bacterium]